MEVEPAAEEGAEAHQAVVPEVSAAVEAKAAAVVRAGLVEPAEGRAAPEAPEGPEGRVEVEEAPEERAAEAAAPGRRSTRTIRTITV